MFEVVHTIDVFWDVPRGGIADFQGTPHAYEADSDLDDDDWADTYLLMPIDQETYDLEVESFAIFCRWKLAWKKGEATIETHPALPQEHARLKELEQLLHGRLTVDRNVALRKVGRFRCRDAKGDVLRELRTEVEWTDPPSGPQDI